MDETKFLLELKLVSSLCLHKLMNLLCEETVSFLSVLSSDPLFSCIVTFCTLVFLYLPHLFLKIVLSPVLILTALLLLSILRLGAIQKSQHERRENQGKPDEPIIYEENRGSKCRGEKQSSSPIEPNQTKSLEQVPQWVHSVTEVISEMGFEPSSCFVEWDVKAPLEVIYEEYGEGEEAGDDANENVGIVRYPSLSRFYPESDSDSESESGFPAIGDWDSPEDIGFGWGEEEEEEEEEEKTEKG
ncbi:tripartite motif-containing protein 26 [Spatholobus suberectus]|nr:tripartite motif-containing protein 26 [Spatholobus suberectus]